MPHAEEISKKLLASSAWLAAAAKTLDKISKWPAVDPSKIPAMEELGESLEKAGVKLVEYAEEIKTISQSKDI